MPNIPIETSTLERLKDHAEPLVDTHDSVVNRALDALEQSAGQPASRAGKKGERLIDPHKLPDLAHTKVLDAMIDGRSMRKPSWNPALRALLGCAMKRGGRDFGALQAACRGKVNMVEGCKTDDGYHHVPELGISFQSLGATDVCAALVTAAQAFGIAVDIGFMWRGREGAAFPGERGRLQIPGMEKPKGMLPRS